MPIPSATGLDSGWTCQYVEREPSLNTLTNDIPVPSLAGWSFDRQAVESRAVQLKRSFMLEPTGDCVNYVLIIESAPANTAIYLNGERVNTDDPTGPDEAPFELDITYDVALGENALAFLVECDAAGRFGCVRLQAVPCE